MYITNLSYTVYFLSFIHIQYDYSVSLIKKTMEKHNVGLLFNPA